MPSAFDYAWFWLLANAGELRDLLVAAAALGVLPFLAYRAWTARRLVAAQQRTAEATELGKSAEVMAAAFAGLGGSQIQVRVGAIYTLERHARDRPRDQGPIVQTLAAFVRDRCPAPVPALVDGAYRAPAPDVVYRPPTTDVQAAVSVLGRRERANDPPNMRLSLAGTNLSGYDLADCDFTGTNFKGSYLCGTSLAGTKLLRADFQLAVLENADFYGADATEASFSAAYCGGARFAHANLNDTAFIDSDLRSADFTGARLERTDLRGAAIDGAAFDRKRLPAGSTSG
ncbi:MAG: pentapeptide repeat-containing protein [Proteobacteria bacterium]|nr:pentapeptide repeat-containing protein [Pseudomonadota bacterium]